MSRNFLRGRSEQFRGQKGQGPLEKSQEMSHYMFCPRQKKSSPGLSKSGVHFYFLVPKIGIECGRERDEREKDRYSM
jgi:hypothetical protein